VQQVAELLIGSERLPQLLQRPISRRVARDIEVQQSSGAVVHHHKDVDLAEGRGDGNEEVASDNSLSVIAKERGPTLIATGPSRGRLGHVVANGAGRNTNSELQQELVADPLLTPGRILHSHASNQQA
jgi:hypothetical protein